jgi:phosphatidylglycerol:prolipoprotein diacylglycerol transferase
MLWSQVFYYLLISLDFIILLFWVIKRSKQLSLSTVISLDLALVLMLSALVGARVFHVIYEAPEFYFNNFLRIFQLWYGGFVFYGGLISAIIFGSLWLIYKKQDLLTWMDFFAPLGSFGYAFGRLSCVVAGCCYGKEASDLPWAQVDQALNDSVLRHPTQWYAVSCETLILIFLLILEKKQILRKGSLFFIWIFLHGVGRLVMETYRDDPRGQVILNLSISSWISIILMIVSCCFFGFRFVCKNKLK